MPHIVVADAQVWLEGTKAHLTALDLGLESQVSSEILARCADTFPDLAPTWIDNNTTPVLVKMAIAMTYAGWYYDRQYSEMVIGAAAGAATTWGMVLRENADLILAGIIDGSIIMPETAGSGDPQIAVEFYPNDASSTTDALLNNTNPDDLSLGPAVFGMNKVF
jgi:hypothetical protein